jgi:NAD(P)-dependent dehydrogenase (short-subunit alcohol dehydrogenase family)
MSGAPEPVALVTGASRGIGRGVAAALHAAGYRVFATGRTIPSRNPPAGIRAIACDHRHDKQTEAAFERIRSEAGRLDVLVNCAWGGYERMVEDGRWTWSAPFWEQPMHRWASMLDGGVRAAFMCSAAAARMMIPAKRGLIVNLSYWAARKYVGNAIYGAAKAATDKMTADMAHELLPFGVTAIALYPGLVRTEAVFDAARAGALDISNSESPEFIGRVIAAIAALPDLSTLSGRVIVAAEIARELGVVDVDGKSPVPLSLNSA